MISFVRYCTICTGLYKVRNIRTQSVTRCYEEVYKVVGYNEGIYSNAISQRHIPSDATLLRDIQRGAMLQRHIPSDATLLGDIQTYTISQRHIPSDATLLGDIQTYTMLQRHIPSDATLLGDIQTYRCYKGIYQVILHY